MKCLSLVLFAVLATGCTIGNGQICGPQTPRAYCDKEAYQRLMYPTPYGKQWVKEGMTREARREDAWACGAAPTVIAADGVIFTREQLAKAQRADEKDDFAAHQRLRDQWHQCMRDKGYALLRPCDARCLHP